MAEKYKRIERTREGVPVWDGDASTYQEYEETVQFWEQSIAVHKRYLCGPRLISELTGTAKRFTVGKHPEWLSFNGGVTKLLTYLRANLGLPQMPELTDHLSRYFRQSRRRKGETMNEYVTRKSELYARARQGLHRVMAHYGKPSTRSSTRWASGSTTNQGRSDFDPWARYEHNQSQAASHVSEDFHEARDPLAPGVAEDEEDEQASQAEATESGRDRWHQDDWWNHGGWWSSRWTPSEDADWKMEAPELLPDYVQGWYLLFDSGLGTSERNMIVAALKGDFTMSRVAQELRSQWTDEDLRRHDAANRASSWWVDENEEEGLLDDHDTGWLANAHNDLNDEGMALVSEAEREVQDALAMVEQGRRTLKEARNKQHQVRMSRKYFRTSFKGPAQNFQSANRGGGGEQRCLRCGGNHRTTSCPKPATTSTAAVASEDQMAPFICFVEDEIELKDTAEETFGTIQDKDMYPMIGFSDQTQEAFAMEDGVPPGPITTKMAVEQGKAVVDGGATKTLGSVEAIERILQLNESKHGHSGLDHVDLSNRPVFGFGNSSRNQCVSTAALKIQADGKPGKVQVHTLDAGTGPVLFSIESLRALGAVIDFEHDLVCFRKLNDGKIIQLERSATGHQLLPMCSDWFERSQQTQQRVPSLRSYI